MGVSVSRPASAVRLRAARRAQVFVVTSIVAAVAWPYFLHFVGFRPALEFDRAVYPGLNRYPFRETPQTWAPSQAPSLTPEGVHGLEGIVAMPQGHQLDFLPLAHG